MFMILETGPSVVFEKNIISKQDKEKYETMINSVMIK